jgi:hypothetical protein
VGEKISTFRTQKLVKENMKFFKNDTSLERAIEKPVDYPQFLFQTGLLTVNFSIF